MVSSMKKLQKSFLAGCLVFVMLLMAGCAKTEDYISQEIHIGSLKGPTSIGLVRLMEQDENQDAANDYSFIMETNADTLLPMIIKEELDIALVPANVAAILYQKTEGQIQVIDINTLGVLYMVSADQTITTFADLVDKTIYVTGKGTTPDYVLQYLLKQSGVSEQVTIEYKAEATEVVAALKQNPEAVGLLPQPFATVATMTNEELKIVMDFNAEWEKTQGSENKMVTGVTIVRSEFLQQNEEAVLKFMEEHEASATYTEEFQTETAALIVKQKILEKEAIALKALPLCNITYLDGEEMKTALANYFKVLYDLEKETVGGKLPDDAFYYIAK